jgi:DNA-binding response OmpR family regulator
LVCRALSQEKFNGHCESVRSFDEGKAYLERALYTPQSLSRPDIVVVNWHPDCDARVLEFVHWVRVQPQLHETPVIVFIQERLSVVAQEQAEHEGVTELMVRPDTFKELALQVRALLLRCVSRNYVR